MVYKIIKVTSCVKCPYLAWTGHKPYCDRPRNDPTIPRLLDFKTACEEPPEWCPLEDGDDNV